MDVPIAEIGGSELIKDAQRGGIQGNRLASANSKNYQ